MSKPMFTDIINPDRNQTKTRRSEVPLKNSFNSENTSPKTRKIRSDKTRDIKFPVTPEIEEALKRRAEVYRPRKQKVNQTVYNTKALLNALDKLKDPVNFPTVEYSDTKRYLHVKLIEYWHDKIFDLHLIWGCSKREVVYRIMYDMVKKGELL
jgi:hypothetical protein